MEIKDLLGDAYKDGMTLEEINAALADKTFVDPTTLPRSVSKEVFDKTASDLAKANKELKELRESSMTADEKLKAETEKALRLQSDYAKELAKLRAKQIFVDAGLTEEEFSKVLDMVVSEDEEITKTRAKSMVDVIAAQKAALDKTLRAELLKGTPKPPAGSGKTDAAAQLKEELAKATNVQDRVRLQRQIHELEQKELGGS